MVGCQRRWAKVSGFRTSACARLCSNCERVDAIIIGSGTAKMDDPMLTVRPTDPADVKRKATRVVVDSLATLSLESQLVKTAREVPVLVAISAAADVEKGKQLVAAGVDVWPCAGAMHGARFESLLDELGRRKMTNVLVEGGSQLLRTLFDAQLIDEVQVRGRGWRR